MNSKKKPFGIERLENISALKICSKKDYNINDTGSSIGYDVEFDCGGNKIDKIFSFNSFREGNVEILNIDHEVFEYNREPCILLKRISPNEADIIRVIFEENQHMKIAKIISSSDSKHLNYLIYDVNGNLKFMLKGKTVENLGLNGNKTYYVEVQNPKSEMLIVCKKIFLDPEENSKYFSVFEINFPKDFNIEDKCKIFAGCVWMNHGHLDF